MNIQKIFFYFFITMFPLCVMAQEQEQTYLEEEIQQRDFDKEKWKNVTKDINYTTEKEVEKIQDNHNPASGDLPDWKWGGNADLAMKIIIALLLGVLLFFIVRSLLGLNIPKNKKIDGVLSIVELAQLEENLHQANLDDFIGRAIAQGNYTLAVRLYYLAILKALSLQARIEWKKDKTNRDYLREMRSAPSFDNFSEVTLLFERIWYGNIELSSIEFQRVEPKFRRLLQQVESAKTLVTK